MGEGKSRAEKGRRGREFMEEGKSRAGWKQGRVGQEGEEM